MANSSRVSLHTDTVQILHGPIPTGVSDKYVIAVRMLSTIVNNAVMPNDKAGYERNVLCVIAGEMNRASSRFMDAVFADKAEIVNEPTFEAYAVINSRKDVSVWTHANNSLEVALALYGAICAAN